MRSDIKACSNSAIAPSMEKNIRPTGVEVSTPYHNSIPNHDDNREYAMNISCGFHNKTQNLNGKGTLAYGYFIAYVDRTYIFKIR